MWRQSLRLANRVLNLMSHFVKPLAVINRLVTVPFGWDAARDALIRQHGRDFVAVVTLVVDQVRRRGEDSRAGRQRR